MSESKEKQAGPTKTGLERFERLWLLGAFSLISFALMAVAFGAVAGYLAFRGTPPAAMAARPAGRVVSVQLLGGLFSRSFVQTDAGFYSLAEGVSLGRGEEVTVEERANGSRYLCDPQRSCTPLLQPLQAKLSPPPKS